MTLVCVNFKINIGTRIPFSGKIISVNLTQVIKLYFVQRSGGKGDCKEYFIELKDWLLSTKAHIGLIHKHRSYLGRSILPGRH